MRQPFKPKAIHVQLKPLADLLARGEGDYDSVNRGRAGDTPQGLTALTGKDYSRTTIREIISMQRGWIYAVGRYQFVPATLRFAVATSTVSEDDYFTPSAGSADGCPVLYKRPAIGLICATIMTTLAGPSMNWPRSGHRSVSPGPWLLRPHRWQPGSHLSNGSLGSITRY